MKRIEVINMLIFDELINKQKLNLYDYMIICYLNCVTFKI